MSTDGRAGHRSKILLVDDQPANLLALEALLEPLGHELVKARSGTEALRFLLDDDDFAVIDLDGFKGVNDRLGHDVGDQLLVEMGHRLRSVLRPCDTLARLGGDEFAILCEDLSNGHDAIEIANRLNDAIAAPFTLSGSEVSV